MVYDLALLGGGQLARMTIMAAQRMGLRCVSLDPGVDTPASQVGSAFVGRLDDPEAIAGVLRLSGAATLENEFIPADALAEGCRLAGFSPERLVPGTDCLATIQDKLRQREAYAAAGVATPRAVALDSVESVESEIGYPMVIKARFGGYDGKGTRWARTREELESHRPLWENGGWLAEEFVPFRRELAVMVALDGEAVQTFPTMETRQENHVCDLVLPCDTDAQTVAIGAARAVGSRGLFGVELFEREDGAILVNEIAPRPHNTGHYTLDWGGPSQFDQHVRLALSLPLLEPVGGEQSMANLLGQADAGSPTEAIYAALAEFPEARFHWYGKKEAKPGRKMGHVNARTPEEALAARAAFYRAWAV
ncbi:ATP-grasp domain-containing protein [bacterium]|nr:MAG: ATP-grasp domain-containing protein [bacterium]